MNKWRRAVGLGMAALLLLLAMVSACAPKGPAPPPVEKPGAKVGVIVLTCYTGAPAAAGVPIQAGQIDVMNYRSEKQNIPIDVGWEESGCDVRKAVLIYKRALAAGCVTTCTVSSSDAETLAKRCVDEGMVVTYGCGYTAGMWTKPKRWIFSAEPPYGDMCGTWVKWVKDNWTEARPRGLG